MAKLVILNQGMTGRAHDLNVDRTTVGRVEDNAFQIAEPSVSSHHCEIQLRGSDVMVHDLNSTNGTFINGEKITETVLKPGQTLRLGNVELRLEAEGQTALPIPPAAPATPPPQPKKAPESTMVISRGISMDQLEQGGRGQSFDTSGAFSKKTNRGNLVFWTIAIVVGIVIAGLLMYVFAAAHR